MKNTALHVIVISLFLFACSKSKDAKLISKGTAQVIEVGNHEFIIEADVFRDMSGSVGDDSLQSIVRLIDRNGNALAGLFSLRSQRLLQGPDTWNTPFDSLLDASHITYLEAISYGGPLWEIGSKVEVICTFQDLETKESYEILASAVTVFEKK